MGQIRRAVLLLIKFMRLRKIFAEYDSDDIRVLEVDCWKQLRKRLDHIYDKGPVKFTLNHTEGGII